MELITDLQAYINEIDVILSTSDVDELLTVSIYNVLSLLKFQHVNQKFLILLDILKIINSFTNIVKHYF